MFSIVLHGTPRRPHKYMNIVQLTRTTKKLSYIIGKAAYLS